jgi:hypothetical protein
VGAVDPVSNEASAWHTYPVDLVAAGLACDAPHPFAVSDRVAFGGTSCSAPVVGGQVGTVLAAARTALADGGTGPRSAQRLVVPDDVRLPALTREDVTRVFLLGAGPIGEGALPVAFRDPLDPATWTVLDGPLSPVHAGWGVHDAETLAGVVDVLTGRAVPVEPDDREAVWFPVDRRIRLDAWGAWDEGVSRVPFPAPLAGPVRLPVAPVQVTALYEASLDGPGAAAVQPAGSLVTSA